MATNAKAIPWNLVRSWAKQEAESCAQWCESGTVKPAERATVRAAVLYASEQSALRMIEALRLHGYVGAYDYRA